ncbi:hypothetical protein B0O99DRAFT_705576 [Bisporella sp. PMI_857]|nr:hypothetical protein B0O99DRAFT_705576 [Bisporella sp. PMI_857]
MAPTTNITITVPEGTSNHGDPDILCVPSKWTDIFLFYAVNYLAHAVTVKAFPGEKLEETAYDIAMAFIYPYSGLLRGIEAITRRAAWCRGNELQRAARAGALCVVVRNSAWQPLNGQIVSGCEICKAPDYSNREIPAVQRADGENGAEAGEVESNPYTAAFWSVLVPGNFYEGLGRYPIIENDRIVHGSRYLPPGYTLACLPSNTKIETSSRDDLANVSISSSYNLVKALVSIVQVFFASATIYKTRGDQIKRYGYAAFGLTVLPYIIMSIVNLVGNLLTPDFPTMYLVRSPEMAEAEHPTRGGWFDRVIGFVDVERSPIAEAQDEDTVNEESILPTPGVTTQVAKNAGERVKKVEHASIDHLEPRDTHQSIGAQLLLSLQRMVSAFGFRKPLRTAIEDQREQILEKPCWISKDQESITRNVFLNHIAWGEIQGSELPPKGATAQMPVRPDLHLKVPTASNFHYDGSQVWNTGRVMLWTYFAFVMSGIPLAVVGGLTRFETGSSTKPQRVWIMGWLVVGTFVGSILPFYVASLIELFTDGRAEPKEKEKKGWEYGKLVSWRRLDWKLVFKIELLFAYAAFAIGGFVVVGQMLKEYGTCNRLS